MGRTGRRNSSRTKPFDHAYQEFSDWVLASAATLHKRGSIDFAGIFRSAHGAKSLNLVRYFAKALGCRIVHAGFEPPTMLRQILSDAGLADTKPLVVTFGINEFWRRVDPTGRIMGDDRFETWPEITDWPCFSWLQTVGYLEIFYCYDLVWEDGYRFGGEPMFSARRDITLGRHGPLPDEPASTMAKL